MHSILRIVLIGVCTLITATGLRSALALELNVSARPMIHSVDENGFNEKEPSLLPPICFSVTESGEREPVCCLSGVVWQNGKAISDAEVTVITKDRSSKIERTSIRKSGEIDYPYYQMELPGVEPNDIITVTARYADREVTEVYTALSGSQRLDLILLGNSTGDPALENTLWNQSAPGRLQKPHGIARNSKGHFYIVDRQNQRIQVFDQEGQPVILNHGTNTWGELGSKEDQFFNPFGIFVDSNDNVYVADTGNHRIQKFSSQGTFITAWGSFGSALEQLYRPEGVVVDSEGFVYVTDSGNHRIQKFHPSDQDVDSSFGEGGFIGSVGAGEGQFRYPTALAIDGQDNLYVTDYQNHRIQTFNNQGKFLNQFGTPDECSSSVGCGPGKFYLPDGIAVDVEKNVYVSDASHRIQKLDTLGNWSVILSGKGTSSGQFEYPKGLSLDNLGNLYVVDEFNDRVQKFDQEFDWLTAWGDEGNNQQQLVTPSGGAVDNKGNLYIADSGENRIQIFNTHGDWVDNIGDGIDEVRFDQPEDVVVDNLGNIYVAESGSHRIQKLSHNGQFIHSWGEKGRVDGMFNQPIALAVDDNNNIYVVDKYNHRIQKFNQNGEHIFTIGGGLGGGIAEGKFNAPGDIVIGPNGNIYVADTANHRIQKFNTEGEHQLTIGGFGGTSGLFDRVSGIDVDQQGNIYGVDRTTRIQKFNAQGVYLSNWGSASIRSNSESKDAPRLNQLTCNEIDCDLRLISDTDGGIYVTDPENNRIQYYRPGNTDPIPIVWINWVESVSLDEDDILFMRALTSGSGTIKWKSSLDGDLGAVPELEHPASDLSAGDHLISVTIFDDQGREVMSDSIIIQVSPPAEEGVYWTLLLYFSADYPDSEHLLQRFNNRISKLQEKFNNSSVRIVIQLDGPGDNDTRRYTLEPGDSEEIEPPEYIGEQDMDDPKTLIEFIRWGQQEFPAKNYYLSIANHGQAIRGISWDMNSGLRDHNDALASMLTVSELGIALRDEDIAPITILHLDACSMNLLETAYEIKDIAQILISSQWLGWDYFAYHDYINAFSKNSKPKDVVKEIIEVYSDTAENNDHPYTISALNMGRSEVVFRAVDDLASELVGYLENNAEAHKAIKEIRENIQTFESGSNSIHSGPPTNTSRDMYVDVANWAQGLIASVDDKAVKNQAQELLDELLNDEFFIWYNEVDSNSLPHNLGGDYIDNGGAHGLSIFYPPDRESASFDKYIHDELFYFTQASIADSWVRFLDMVTLPCEGTSDCGYPESYPLSPLWSEEAPNEDTEPPPDVAATPTATSTATSIKTSTPIDTATHTATPTATATATDTATPTDISPTVTATPTDTATHTATPIATGTETATHTATSTRTPTNTVANTITPTATSTSTDIPTATIMPTSTETPTTTDTATYTPTSTNTEVPTATIMPTSTETPTSTGTATYTPTSTSTETPTLTDTATHTPTPTSTGTPTPSATVTSTETLTPTATSTVSPTSNPDGTSVDPEDTTPTSTETPTPTDTPIPPCNKARTSGSTCNLYLPVIRQQ